MLCRSWETMSEEGKRNLIGDLITHSHDSIEMRSSSPEDSIFY